MARFVPIKPSEPHPDTGGVLLRAGPGTRKRLPPDPYVDIGESTLVPFATLRDYNGARNGREKLSLVPESYVQLAEMLDELGGCRERSGIGRRWFGRSAGDDASGLPRSVRTFIFGDQIMKCSFFRSEKWKRVRPASLRSFGKLIR